MIHAPTPAATGSSIAVSAACVGEMWRSASRYAPNGMTVENTAMVEMAAAVPRSANGATTAAGPSTTIHMTAANSSE